MFDSTGFTGSGPVAARERLVVEGGHWTLRWHGPAGVAAGVSGRALAPADSPPAAACGPVARVDQVHGIAVATVAAAGNAGPADALVTTRPGLRLDIRVADCVPVLIAAPGGVAAVHAGWRGAVGGVVERTIERLVALGAGAPDEMSAWIGPAIGSCCFEVGDEVAARFPARFRRRGPQREHVDLRAFVESLLAEAKLPLGASSPYCTRCHQHLWHSHRGSNGRPGRLLAWIRRGGQIESSVAR
jgi:YfiH family protein